MTAPRRATVLLAEDNTVNQRIALGMLKSLGCVVHVVDNGRETVAAAAGMDFDLILMDCQMPVMDGYEATAAIRAAEADDGRGTRRIPIVALTASATSHDQQRCLDAGMDGHLAKPLRTDQLAAVVFRLRREQTVGVSRTSFEPGLGEPGTSEAIATRDARTIEAISSRLAELFDGLDGDIDGDSVDLMQSFQRRAVVEIDAIARAVAHDDAPATRQHAHSLRGMAANVGATRLAADAAEVEDAARDGRMPVPTSVIAELRLGLFEVERAVTELFAARIRVHESGPSESDEPRSVSAADALE